jgi:hypothetical protein
MQEAAERYPGFRQYAKILERTARGIQGASAVPGRRARPQQNDPVSEYRRLAAGMDLHMEQLAEDGVPVSTMIDRIAGHLPDLPPDMDLLEFQPQPQSLANFYKGR